MSATVLLPICPTSNHAYRAVTINGHHSRAYSDEMHNWHEHALYLCRGLAIPERTPLSVAIRVRLGRARINRVDLDNFVKPVLDVCIGSRADQYVRFLEIRKQLADVGEEGVDVCVSWERGGD